jgi:transcriptional regulator with XRE-family HTH domain
MLGAEAARLRQLGALLRLRRAAFGYRYRPAFVKARGTNERMVSDIERGRRDTYTFPSLEDVAGAYDVTYKSMMAVVWSDAAELVPAPAEVAEPVLAGTPAGLDPAAPASGVAPVAQLPPMTDAVRIAGAKPYADAINRRLRELAGQGLTEPPGARVFPASPDDAKAWDGIGARMDTDDRVWFIADLQRRADGRDGSAGSASPEVTPR